LRKRSFVLWGTEIHQMDKEGMRITNRKGSLGKAKGTQISIAFKVLLQGRGQAGMVRGEDGKAETQSCQNLKCLT
jgi:hypothetical protein